MKHLASLLIIFVTVYVLLIFMAPQITSKIEETIWIDGLTESITDFKWNLDESVTDIPTKDELKDAYNKAYSWALEYKEQFDLWVEKTHEKVDDIRDTLKKAEDTYNTVKDSYEQTKQTLENTKKILDESRQALENIQTIQSASWSIDTLTGETLSWSTSTWTINE